MADTTKRIIYNIEVNDKGKVKIDGITKGFIAADNAVNKMTLDLKKQQSELSNLSKKGLKPVISDAGLAGATLTEFGRTISDANFGIRGIANNLSQLSTLFITLVSKEGGGVRGFGAALTRLGQQIMGPLGIILIFQTAITLLERFAMKQDEATKATENLTEAIDDQIRRFELLSENLFEFNLTGESVRDTAVLLAREFKSFDKQLTNLLENDTRLAVFGRDAFGEITTTVFEGDKAIKQLIITFQDLQKNEREIAIQQQKLRELEGQDTKEKIKAEGILKELLRERQDIQRTLSQNQRVENAREIDDLEEQIEFTVKLKEEELKLKQERSNEEDPQFIQDMDKLDKRTSEFTDSISEMNRKEIEAFEANRDARFSILMEIVDNNFFANQSMQKQDEALTARKEELLMQEVQAAAFAADGIAMALGEESAAGKAFAIAAATMNTFVGVTASLKKGGFVGIAEAVAVAAFGVAQIRKILEVDETGGGRLKGGGRVSGSSASIEAPDFNVVGASPESQLAQSVRSQVDKPLRAFVVHKDIADADELDRNIRTTSALG